MRKFFIWTLIFSLILSLTLSVYLLFFRGLEIYASIFFFFSILIYGFISIYNSDDYIIKKDFSRKNKKLIKNLLPPLIATKLRGLLNDLNFKNISKYEAFDSQDEDFKFYLNKSKVYGEYGMGNSTKLAIEKKLIIYSVDTDLSWVSYCKSQDTSKSNKLIWVDLGEVKNWGFPNSYEKIKNIDNYLNFIWQQNFKPDLVLIDGRFRVACFLTCLKYADEGTLIIFDDYVERKIYHIVERFIYPFQNNSRQSFFRVTKNNKSQIDEIDELISHFKYVMD